jgi:hypothetical protein
LIKYFQSTAGWYSKHSARDFSTGDKVTNGELKPTTAAKVLPFDWIITLCFTCSLCFLLWWFHSVHPYDYDRRGVEEFDIASQDRDAIIDRILKTVRRSKQGSVGHTHSSPEKRNFLLEIVCNYVKIVLMLSIFSFDFTMRLWYLYLSCRL